MEVQDCYMSMNICREVKKKKKVFFMCLKPKDYSYYKSLCAILPSFFFIRKWGEGSKASH